jgi:hypothetical protein
MSKKKWSVKTRNHGAMGQSTIFQEVATRVVLSWKLIKQRVFQTVIPPPSVYGTQNEIWEQINYL